MAGSPAPPPTLYEWAGGDAAFGADVIPQAPVPRWGWGEAPPFDG